MPKVIGITFPIPKSYMSRFFKEGKTVFIKPTIVFKELHEGMKFVFYQSCEDTGYVGEAIIKRFTFAENPYTFFEIYGDNIFLTRDELDSYINEAKNRNQIDTRRKRKPRAKQWIAIELGDIQEYSIPIKPDRFVSISGRYLKIN